MRFASFNVANLVGGGALALIGAYTAWGATAYPIGQLNRMGPGYMPLALGILLIGLSLGIIAQGRDSETPLPRIRVVALLWICAGIVGFAVTVELFGMVPATFVVVILASRAEARFRWVTAGLTAVALSVFAWLVFIRSLGVPVDAFRWPG